MASVLRSVSPATMAVALRRRLPGEKSSSSTVAYSSGEEDSTISTDLKELITKDLKEEDSIDLKELFARGHNNEVEMQREARLEQRMAEQQTAIERLTDRVRSSDGWMEEQQQIVERLQDRVSYLEGELIKQMSDKGAKGRPEFLVQASAGLCETNGSVNGRREQSANSYESADACVRYHEISPCEANHGIIHSVTSALSKPVRLATMPVRYAGYRAGCTALAPYRIVFGMLGKVNGLLDTVCFRTMGQVEGLLDTLKNGQLVKADELLEDMQSQTIPKMNNAADSVNAMVEKSASIPDKVDGLLDHVQNGPLMQVDKMLKYADTSTLKKVDSLIDLLRALVLLLLFALFGFGIRAFSQAIRGNSDA